MRLGGPRASGTPPTSEPREQTHEGDVTRPASQTATVTGTRPMGGPPARTPAPITARQQGRREPRLASGPLHVLFCLPGTPLPQLSLAGIS